MGKESTTVALAARTRAAGTLELLIYDDIGDGGGGLSDINPQPLTAKSVREQVSAAGQLSEIEVRINSAGGDTADGFAIYNLLREHPANVTVHIDGDAMSIASIIAQAGDLRVIAPNARMMIHEARLMSMRPLGERELKAALSNLETVNQSLVDTYERHTGQAAEQIREWMAAETYMTAALAKERGFVDEISGESAEDRIAAWADTPLGMVPPSGRGESMADLKTIALAVGLGEGASEQAIVAKFGELTAAVAAGKAAAKERDELVSALGADSVESAKGLATAAASAVEQAKTLAQRVESLEKTEQDRERAGVIAAIKAEGKCTPAQERDLFPTMSLEALRAFAKAAPRILARSPHSEPGAEGNAGDEPMKHEGKTFAALKPMERARLKREDPDTYAALRRDAQDRGQL